MASYVRINPPHQPQVVMGLINPEHVAAVRVVNQVGAATKVELYLTGIPTPVIYTGNEAADLVRDLNKFALPT